MSFRGIYVFEIKLYEAKILGEPYLSDYLFYHSRDGIDSGIC